MRETKEDGIREAAAAAAAGNQVDWRAGRRVRRKVGRQAMEASGMAGREDEEGSIQK